MNEMTLTDRSFGDPMKNRSVRRHRPWGIILLAMIGASLLSGLPACAGRAATVGDQPAVVNQNPLFPGADWPRWASPEAAGFSTSKLDSLRNDLKPLATTGLVAIAGGKIVFEYGDIVEVSYIASVRKSVLAMLFGRYVESGSVRLDKTLREMKITDHGGLSEQELEATIADLLSARSGVYHPASNSGDNLADAPPRGSQKHGTYFLYSNWDFNALGTIFEKETGRDLYDALESDIVRPIGLQDFRHELHEKSGDLTRSIHPAYHMHFSTRDMARIGYLMLREGQWAGRQIVPRGWTKRITTPITRNTETNPAGYRGGPFGYGFLWWVFDGPTASGPFEGAYTGIGVGGQYITVMPKLDLVVAHKVKIPGSDGSVSTGEYFAILQKLAAARTDVTSGPGAGR
jgi:CubicO group peptidase (beta-lactamase class C family)